MIVPITGNIAYKITLDPTVWIFDDRKILLEEAFSNKVNKEPDEEDELEQSAQRWNRAVNQHKIKPPINKSISRFEREKILVNSYVMPIGEFVNYAEIKDTATDVTLSTKNGEIKISLDDLRNCYLLFAIEGKPLKEDGPVHLFYQDGSNKDEPITGVEKIIVN